MHHLNKKNIHCCDDGDFCNTDSYSVQQISEEKFPVLIVTSSIVSVLVVMLILFVTYFKFRRKNTDLAAKVEENKKVDNNNLEGECQNTVQNSLPTILEQSSGSGSGFPIMVQRTIAKQIDMVSNRCRKINCIFIRIIFILSSKMYYDLNNKVQLSNRFPVG